MELFDSSEEDAGTVFIAQLGESSVAACEGALSLSAFLPDTAIQTVLITATEDFVRITIQDLSSGLLYRLSGSLKTGSGTVLEIDPSKLPPIKRRPPLVAREEDAGKE